MKSIKVEGKITTSNANDVKMKGICIDIKTYRINIGVVNRLRSWRSVGEVGRMRVWMGRREGDGKDGVMMMWWTKWSKLSLPQSPIRHQSEIVLYQISIIFDHGQIV